MADAPPWKAEFVRLTSLFPQRQPKLGLWESVVGRPSDASSEDRRLVHAQESGMFDDMILTCVSTANRVDWLISPSPTQAQQPDFGQLISFAAGVASLAKVGAKWFALSEPANRIAFGAVLSAAVPTREAGYAVLGGLLPAVKLSDSSEDFLYQINHPKPSDAAPGLRINRLSKWSVAMMQHLQLTVAGTTLVPMGVPSEPLFACRLELDINNADAGGLPIPAGKIGALWQELATAAQEIAAKGDHE